MARTILIVALYGVGRVFADCLVSMREITAIDCQPCVTIGSSMLESDIRRGDD